VYGGEERWLRSGGTLFSLQKLHDKGHLGSADFHELAGAYQLLRKIEHRLQFERGRQIHVLPRDYVDLRVIQRMVDRGRQDDDAAAFLSAVQRRMARVAEICERILRSERYAQRVREAERMVAQRPANIREMTLEQMLQRIAVESPELHRVVARQDLDRHARRNLTRFLGSALTGSERYAALLENPKGVELAISLLENSDYLTDILVRHPDVIRDLARPAPPSIVGRNERESHVLEQDMRDANVARAQLRREFRKRVFAAGANDVLSPRQAFASMAEITGAGDAAIREALRIVDGQRSLAVFALGRLGTGEFDIASDADLLFVRAPDVGEDEARLHAERLVHALSAYTREGTICAVDSRLRPHGAAGELVVTAGQVDRYLAEEAQPWEALTYTKLRFIAGREDVRFPVSSQVWQRIVDLAAKTGFTPAVTEMRARLEKANRYPHSFKLARGGFYDIDFIASYLMLTASSPIEGNTVERLRRLVEIGVLDGTPGEELMRAAILYRTADHVIRLVTGRARPELPEAEHARASVEKLVNRIVDRDPSRSLQGEHEETSILVREIFERMLAG
jgi:glutamate-ammonia-ligase adenylyltransferase